MLGRSSVVLICLWSLISVAKSRTITHHRVYRSPQSLPTRKINLHDLFTHKTSNLHGFQYEVYFPQHQKINKNIHPDTFKHPGDNLKASGTSEYNSILPPQLPKNMEVRPVEADAGSGYLYEPPTFEPPCHHDVAHDAPEGYVYQPPELPIVEDNRKVFQTEEIGQSTEYSPSASDLQEVVQSGPSEEGVFPNYSLVKFRSSFFGEDGLPRIVQDGDTDNIPPEYSFAYVIRGETELGHQESLTDGAAQGSYHVLLPDGRLQRVSYEADNGGYRPVIKYQPESPEYRRNNIV